MDRFKHENEEEYILAMRTTMAQRNDTDDGWRNRRAQPLQQGEPSLSYNQRKSTVKTLLPMTDNHTTKVLASLVPDEIIYNVDDYTNKPYDVCLLFGDVSGFTDLSEMYNKTGRGGPSRLTLVLNSYIGSMVQEIISHGGDVMKFSGDAFLAMWKSGAHNSLQDAVHEALDSALMIQKTLGKYETDVGVFLRVKLAISAGHVLFSLIGDPSIAHYIVIGQPIWDVKTAEKKASAGEIVMSASAWRYITPSEYVWEYAADGIHIKVKAIGMLWRPTQSNVERYNKQGDDEASLTESAAQSEEDMTEIKDDRSYQSLRRSSKTEEISLRPTVDYAAKMHLKDDLRKFVISPVMRAIDLDEPIEYLTEMRQMSIIFINVVVKPKLDLALHVKLVDTSYKMVCSLVTEMKGCVNKVSLFDKDLMFVLLFGLRGYKSELETQTALRCAAECYNGICKLPNVISTSIGVTTGITYCGVVGHTLRREYTVIGLTVNKAARLMCAYPDKVTCDRETFIHSKLEAKHFILQKGIHLKGISNAGTVYEFKEQFEVALDKPVINHLPLLGRSEELRLYKRLLDDCIQIAKDKNKTITMQMLNHHNMLLIRGKPRIGKTRLLDELVYITPPVVHINRFTLRKFDKKVPYNTLQCIISKSLGLAKMSSQDREAKLKLNLNEVNMQDSLCALNEVFNVNFEKTSLFASLSEQQKVAVLEKILKQLCYVAFLTLWVIAIDDADYIDEESWSFLRLLLDLDVVFIITTIGSQTELSEEAHNTISQRRVRDIELRPIDKWYHGGLTCQILDVYAIPAELEKLTQTRSGGNPGWIESFLISLMQAGGIIIKTLPQKEINELGLVFPPVEMMVRMASQDTIRNSTDGKEYKEDAWKMYKYSYKGSVIHLPKESEKETATLLPVCVISPNFNLDEIDPELSMDAIIIRMFDSLTSYEQLLLKCSSVLGEYFPRDMLQYIMATSTQRDTAMAVQKLFELRVLACAKGEFTEGEATMVFAQRLVNPNEDYGIKCECRGVNIPVSCRDLPAYASCGYLRFRIHMFRDTTYDLLTDNQKKEFHNRAIRYLEKETKRCRACGNGFFVRILGTRQDDGFLKIKKRKPKSKSREESRSSSFAVRVSNSEELGNLSALTNSSKKLFQPNRKDTLGNYSKMSEGSIAPKVSDIDMLPPRLCMGFNMINKLKFNSALTRTFSYVDFSSCQCPQILSTMYTSILEHCKGAGQTEKMMAAMLEHAYTCITTYNIPQAIKILEEASSFIDHEAQNTAGDAEAWWRIPLLRGKVDTLVGYARLELGQLEEANLCFLRGLKNYGYTFPTSSVKRRLNSTMYELKQRLGMYFFPSLCSATTKGYEAEFNDDLSECLSLLCDLFKETRMWEHAELAASWSLNRSLASDSDFLRLCVAYGNMLDIAHHKGKMNLCVALEVHALRLCHRKKSNVELQEVKAVAVMYGIIFRTRLTRSLIEYATQIGFVVLRMCAAVRAIQTSIQVLPLLVQALLLRCRISEAVTMILELEYCCEEDKDNSGRTWFYALCVMLQLESSYSIFPFKRCEYFYQEEGDTLVNIRDIDAEKRFYTVMWLWYARNDDWDAASIWYEKLNSVPVVNHESLNNLITLLYLLEGLLLKLVVKMNSRNIRDVECIQNKINYYINALEDAGKITKIVLPRLQHLKGYYKTIQNHDVAAGIAMRTAKKMAESYENLLEASWIEHSEKAWSNNLPAIAADFWREHCDPDNFLDYHEVDINEGRIGLFTFPLPLYY